MPSLPLLFLLLLVPVYAVSELKFNAGALKRGGYDDDPSSYVSGSNRKYRGPDKPGLTVGNSHRWGDVDGFAYDFPLGDGVYDIDLIFAEVYGPNQKAGVRVFDVDIEDDTVLENFDVFKEAGADTEITKTFTGITVDDGSLTISFMRIKAKNNPMVSGLKIRRQNGDDLSLDGVITGEGTGSTAPPIKSDFDHQSHAVAGGPYKETDYNNDGVCRVKMDGTLSHSHYNNPDTGESGRIVSYKWTVGGSVISTKPVFTDRFKVGITEVFLTVKDQKGDTATARTNVLAYPSTAGGAYCYFYPGATNLSKSFLSGQRPVEGHSTNALDYDDDEFDYSGRDEKIWAARCVTDYTSLNTTRVKFSIRYQGAGAVLYVNRGLKTSGGVTGIEPRSISKRVTVRAGKNVLQIMYYRNGDSGSLQLLVGNKVVTPKQLAFKSSSIVPAISSISPKTVDPTGGGQLQIVGTGMFNNPVIRFGRTSFTPSFNKVSATELVINSIPTQAEAGGADSVDIWVTNDAGVSNKVQLVYAETTKRGVAWQQTYFKSSSGNKYSIKQITSVAIGPDANYYMGSLAGYVLKVKADKDLIVNGQCTGPNLGRGRAVLSLAFYHKSKTFRVYVSTSTMYWAKDGPFKDDEEGWANGAVESLTEGCGCLCYEKKVVTGLPVSNHDHAVNEITFLNNGDMLIAVGGSTNGGHNTPGNKLGGYPESPLSGAILLATLSDGNSFDGEIRYDQYTNPETCKKTKGDVEVYVSGLRNCFGVVEMTDGEIWGTDNGGNFGYGDVSKNCREEVRFTVKEYDELNRIVKGKYYGHPNRNRGQKDSQQCVHSNFGDHEAAMEQIQSSTPGIVEYTSNAFSGGLKNEIILSKYAASGTGVAFRYSRSERKLVAMAPYSGLRVVNGLHGELIMPRVQQGFVAVLKPKYEKPSGPMVIAVSPRKGTGGKRVFVSGENFKTGLTVRFGDKVGTNVGDVKSTGFFVDVPSGSGKVAVEVEVNGVSSGTVAGYDFIYL